MPEAQNQPTLHVVTRNGVKVSQPKSLAEANQEAIELRKLLESKQDPHAKIDVVPVLMG